LQSRTDRSVNGEGFQKVAAMFLPPTSFTRLGGAVSAVAVANGKLSTFFTSTSSVKLLYFLYH
jgi:hypothetical protein